MPLEIEEKLQVNSTRVFERIREEGHVAGAPMSRGQLGLQRDTYLDTPAGRLFHTGASLRLREKDGRYIVTMKTPVEGTRVRTEDEAFLTANEAADFLGGAAHKIDCDIMAAAVDYADGARLATVLQASNQRETWNISSPQGSMQMCFDWVEYSDPTGASANRTAEEFELELQQGPRSLVVTAAAHLAQRFGLEAQTRSKYERGVMLLEIFTEETASSPPERQPACEDVLLAV